MLSRGEREKAENQFCVCRLFNIKDIKRLALSSALQFITPWKQRNNKSSSLPLNGFLSLKPLKVLFLRENTFKLWNPSLFSKPGTNLITCMLLRKPGFRTQLTLSRALWSSRCTSVICYHYFDGIKDTAQSLDTTDKKIIYFVS